MTSRNFYALIGASALSLALSACGGAGGGVNFASTPPTPTPAPTPTPTPTPTPAPPPLAPPHIGLVSNQPFAVVAAGDTYTLSANNQVRTNVSGPSFQDVQLSYNPSANTYTISLPGFETGTLTETSYNGSSGQPATGSFSWVSSPSSTTHQPVGVTLQVPATTYSPYTYTSFGWWFGKTNTASNGDVTHQDGIFAYGIPTSTSAMPVLGNATYSAKVIGDTVDGYGYGIGGGATLQFAFASGTLSGHFDPVIYDWDTGVGLGRYDFSNTVYAAGSTNFSGGLSQSGVGTGSFSGQFTGPNAEELMARWTAPLNNPLNGSRPSMMYGVWIGKKD